MWGFHKLGRGTRNEADPSLGYAAGPAFLEPPSSSWLPVQAGACDG